MNGHPLFSTPAWTRGTLDPLRGALLILLCCFWAFPGQTAPADHSILMDMGIEATDLPENLYLVRSSGPLTLEPGITVHGRLRDTFLVSGDKADVEALRGRGCFVLALPESVSETSPVKIPVDPVDKTADPAIQALVDQLTWESLGGKIQWLVDFGTRYSFDPVFTQVAESLQVYFTDLGLAVEMHSFTWEETLMYNVIATQVGSVHPDQFYVICGHYDSISQSPKIPAPGADDNGTGTATVMAAAEILSQQTFEYSIKYICFGAEEQGMIGSYFYVRDAVAAGVNIVGALNFDMMGYWEEGVEADLEIETNTASLPLAEVVVTAADLYTDAVYELHHDDSAWWGDFYRFWNLGIPAINHEEAWDWGDPDFNPYYHTKDDLMEYVGPDFTLRNAKVGLASLATLAQLDTATDVPLSVDRGFDLRLTASPNPFNGNVRLSVETAAHLPGLDLEIFDLRGRLVTRIPVDLIAGKGEAKWLGLDSDGRPVESGVYLCRSPQAKASSALRISYVK